MEKSKLSFMVNIAFVFIVIFLLAIFIGSRELYIGTDTLAYSNFYFYTYNGIETRISEPLFSLTAKISSFFSTDFSFFAILIAFISTSCYFLFYYGILIKDKIDSNSKYYIVFVAFILMLISPFFWNSQINVMRIGVAIPIFFLGTYFLFISKTYKALIFFILSVLFHYSMIIFIPFILLIRWFKEKQIITIFILLSIVYVTGIGETLFKIVTQHISSLQFIQYYLANATNERGYQNGVRLDFYVFTLFFFIVAFIMKNYSSSSNYIFRSYTLLTFPFLILGFINFSDRIAIISWSLIPILMALVITRFAKANNFTYVFIVLSLIFVLILSLWYKNLI